jgi:hypothetical protein
MLVMLMIGRAPVGCYTALERAQSPGILGSRRWWHCLHVKLSIAAAYGACQGVWLARLLKDLSGGKLGVPTLRVDNKSAIDLAKNPVHHERSKHVETKFHYIRKSVEDGKISLEQVSTGDQLADIMTKSLTRVKFQELRDRIGVVNIKLQHQA